MERDEQGYLISKDNYSTIDIFELGRIVFDNDPHKFGHWLASYCIWAFNYEQPAKLFKTQEGRNRVAQVLFSIEYDLIA